MRGIPLLEIFFIATLFGLAAIPLARLTGTPKQISQQTQPLSTPEGIVPSFVSGTFAHEPISATVGGSKLEAPHFEADINVSLGEGLALVITWPEGTPKTAATITLETDGRPATTHTFWSTPGATSLKAAIPTP